MSTALPLVLVPALAVKRTVGSTSTIYEPAGNFDEPRRAQRSPAPMSPSSIIVAPERYDVTASVRPGMLMPPALNRLLRIKPALPIDGFVRNPNCAIAPINGDRSELLPDTASWPTSNTLSVMVQSGP